MSGKTPKSIGRWNLQDSDALTDSIESVYRAFSHYKVPPKLDAPDHREPLTLRRKLTALPLRELDSEALGAYSGWAMTTVDGPDTYRHFLPRILEFALDHCPHMGFEPAVIAGKLDYGTWRTWPEAEQIAIANFFHVAWEHTLEDEYDTPDWFLGIARAGLNIDQALNSWQHNKSPNALLKCAHTIGFDIGRVDGEIVIEGGFWDDVSIYVRRKITAWLLSPELRARLVEALSNRDPGSEDPWIFKQGIATWDRLALTEPPINATLQ